MTNRVAVDADQVERLLEAFLARSEPAHHAELRRWATFHHALPIIADMGGCIALRPDGSFVSFAWDNETEATDDLDPYLLHTVRGVGARKYPSLDGLAPTRGPQARSCKECGGIGVPDPRVPNRVCACGGLGWVP